MILGAIAGGLISTIAGKALAGDGGAGAAAATAEKATAEQRKLFKPYVESGTKATGRLEELLGLAPIGSGGSAGQSTQTNLSIGSGNLGQVGDILRGAGIDPKDFSVSPENRTLSTEDVTSRLSELGFTPDKLQELGITGTSVTQLRTLYQKMKSGELGTSTAGTLNTQGATTPGGIISETIRGGINQATGKGGVSPAATQQTISDVFEQTPGYQFTLQQGEKAIKRAGAASGQIGGKLYTELVDYAAGLAGTQFQTYMDNLFRLSSLGQASVAGEAAAIQSGSEATAAAQLAKGRQKQQFVGDLASIAGEGVQAYLDRPKVDQLPGPWF